MDSDTQLSSAPQDAEELPSDRIADLVELIVCGLVDDEDAVSLDVTDREDGTLIEMSALQTMPARSSAGTVARSRPFARLPAPSGSASAPQSTSRCLARSWQPDIGS